jgi:hypothetical protein
MSRCPNSCLPRRRSVPADVITLKSEVVSFAPLTQRRRENENKKNRIAERKAPILVTDGLRAIRRHTARGLPAELDERAHVQKYAERRSEDRHQDERVYGDQFVRRIKREHLKR